MAPLFRCVFFAVLLLAGGGARAAESPPPASLTLREAVLSALAQNPALALRREDIAQRDARRLQTAGEFDPHLNALYSAAHVRTPGVNRDALTFQSYLRSAGVDPPALTDTLDPFSDVNVIRYEDYNYQLSLTQKLRNGIVISPQASVNVNEGISPIIAPIASGRVGLAVQVPLLRGLGRDATGAREAAARGEVEVARLLYRHDLAVQAARTATAYWTSCAADETARIRRDSETRATTLLESMRVLVQASVLPPALLTQAEANLLEKRAIRLDSELAAGTARIELGRALGLAPERIALTPEPTEAFPAVAAAPVGNLEAIAAWVAFALMRRADHLAVRRSRDPAAILARKAQRDLLPRLDVGLQAGYAGLSAGRTPLDALQERRTGGNAAVTISLDWPLRNSLQTGELREARAREREVEARVAVLVREIAADVATAARELSLRAELAAAVIDALRVAERAVTEERERLRIGETSLPDVIALENALNEARLRRTAAQAGYAITLTRFRFAVGALFDEERSDGTFELASLIQVPPSP